MKEFWSKFLLLHIAVSDIFLDVYQFDVQHAWMKGLRDKLHSQTLLSFSRLLEV